MTAIQWIVASAIAAFAATMAYFQWRTAHQRVVLDLFDRRNEVYIELRNGATAIVSAGKAGSEVETQLIRAVEKARFYFGDDVVSELDEFLVSAIHIDYYASEIEGAQGDEKRDLIAKRRLSLNKIEEFSKRAPELFIPYMRLDQKMPSLWRPGCTSRRSGRKL